MSARNFEINGTKKRFGNVTIEREGIYTRVILHKTCVVELNNMSNIVTLNTGGWNTVTTKATINNAMKQIAGLESVQVFQRKGQWLVSVGKKEVEFQDGMRIGGGFGAPIGLL